MRARRIALLGLGWLCVAAGVVGIAVPGLPTTVFPLVALWAFGRSSERFHAWLYGHPRLGPPLRAWHEHGAIPPRAKLLAVVVMAAGLVVTTLASATWVAPAALGAILIPVGAFIVTRPGRHGA